MNWLDTETYSHNPERHKFTPLLPINTQTKLTTCLACWVLLHFVHTLPSQSPWPSGGLGDPHLGDSTLRCRQCLLSLLCPGTEGENEVAYVSWKTRRGWGGTKRKEGKWGEKNTTIKRTNIGQDIKRRLKKKANHHYNIAITQINEKVNPKTKYAVDKLHKLVTVRLISSTFLSMYSPLWIVFWYRSSVY